jgi:hypothetical protein
MRKGNNHMLLILEIGMSLYGLYALISGKFSLGKKGIVSGTQARIAGAIYLATAPVIFLFGVLLGVLIAIGVLPESSQLLFGIILELVLLFVFYFIGRTVAEKGFEEQAGVVEENQMN